LTFAGWIDAPEHREHRRYGLGRGLAYEPRGEGDAGFSFMQDQHRPRPLADDEVAFPMMVWTTPARHLAQ
jgi:hypothetical protein